MSSCRPIIRSTVGLNADDVWSRFGSSPKRPSWLDEQEVAPEDRTVRYSVDLRYEQQGFEVTIDLPGELAARGGDLREILDEFHTTHEWLYGVRFPVPVELVALREVATGATPAGRANAAPEAVDDLAAALMEMRRC